MIRMRDKNHKNFIEFEEQVRRFIGRNFQESLFLKNPVVDSPTFLEDYTIIYPRKYSELENLILLHWFLPETLMWRINLDLSERNYNNFNEKQQIILRILLSSRRNCLLYFFETERFSSHEFWGKLGQVCKTQLRNIPIDKKVVKPKRKRGYDDKGSSRPKEKWLPSYDYSLTELQNQKEYDQYLTERKITRILNYFEKL